MFTALENAPAARQVTIRAYAALDGSTAGAARPLRARFDAFSLLVQGPAAAAMAALDRRAVPSRRADACAAPVQGALAALAVLAVESPDTVTHKRARRGVTLERAPCGVGNLRAATHARRAGCRPWPLVRHERQRVFQKNGRAVPRRAPPLPFVAVNDDDRQQQRRAEAAAGIPRQVADGWPPRRNTAGTRQNARKNAPALTYKPMRRDEAGRGGRGGARARGRCAGRAAGAKQRRGEGQATQNEQERAPAS